MSDRLGRFQRLVTVDYADGLRARFLPLDGGMPVRLLSREQCIARIGMERCGDDGELERALAEFRRVNNERRPRKTTR